MSVIIRKDVKCAVCGKISKKPIILSTISFGGCDLDGRPHGLARNLLTFELQECYRCGYVNYNIEVQPQLNFEEGKLQCDLESELAFRYYKFAKYNARIGKQLLAFELFLSAAWACDDYKAKNDALRMRVELIRVYEKHKSKIKNLNSKSILVDAYRRTKQFKKAISLIDDVGIVRNKRLNKILAFQRELCNKKDDKCHTTLEIF